MPSCKICGQGFDTPQQLGGHVRSQHPKEKKPAQSGARGICPVCDFQNPGLWGRESMELTVCARCLAFFNPKTGELLRPPPEKCVAELSGMVCKTPAHKYYRDLFDAGAV